MQIPALSQASAVGSSNGLAATAAAIRDGQVRFDDAAAQVVQDTTDAAGDEPAVGSLVQDLVGMKVDSLTNSILYGVFRRQSEQLQDLAKIADPSH